MKTIRRSSVMPTSYTRLPNTCKNTNTSHTHQNTHIKKWTRKWNNSCAYKNASERGREWVSEGVIILFRENSCVRLHVCKQRRIIELLVWKCWNEQPAWEGGSWTSSRIPPTRSHTITAHRFTCISQSYSVTPFVNDRFYLNRLQVLRPRQVPALPR